jgi:23S rRNA pseudouridine1911/1915/1917 synthase
MFYAEIQYSSRIFFMKNQNPPPDTRTVPENHTGLRLDKWLMLEFPDHSRSEIQKWIRSEYVRSGTEPLTPGLAVKPGMRFQLTLPAPQAAHPHPIPENLPLEILYEDPHLVVVNKFSGQVVHPAPGHPSGTVLNAMLHHYPDMESAGDPLRPGLVHRLDLETSGVLLFARTPEALAFLQAQFKERAVSKTYHCLCHSIPNPISQRIDLPLGRHPIHRKKRAINGEGSRPAVSHMQLLKGLASGTASLLEVKIETGRTHQIRVHLAHLGHPVLGDTVYGGKRANLSKPWPQAPRIMLHAFRLSIRHPCNGSRLELEAAPPLDMIHFQSQLEHPAP